ncbi:hypothetical protein [Streptomyces winkii]|uniref:hypothetical protein n=1 Tax=Streptomyces winkii TaxID=3051178 RepID=UPI0028D6BA18|nr:hypothetical protein [Streptomyces sp. DSM 40971]
MGVPPDVAFTYEDLHRLGAKLDRVYEWSRDLGAGIGRVPAPDVGDAGTRSRLAAALDDQLPKCRRLALDLEKAARGVNAAASRYQSLDSDLKEKFEGGDDVGDYVTGTVLKALEDAVFKRHSTNKVLDDFT